MLCYSATDWLDNPTGTEGREAACKQLVQALKLLTVQGTVDEVELAPLLMEVSFLAQQQEGQQHGNTGTSATDSEVDNELAENELVHQTALHLAVYFNLENVASLLLPHAGEALHSTSCANCLRRTPFHLACDLGRRTMAMLLLRHGANVNDRDPNW